MDSHINRAILQRPLDLLGKKTNLPNRGKWHIPVAVTMRLDLNQLDIQSWV
jgi:hypothetical protein